MGAKDIATGLAKNTGLTALDLSFVLTITQRGVGENKVEAEGVKAIADALKQNKVLQNLNLCTDPAALNEDKIGTRRKTRARRR